MLRDTLKYVPDKDRNAFATDLKTIYHVADEKKALVALKRVTEKWMPQIPLNSSCYLLLSLYLLYFFISNYTVQFLLQAKKIHTT